MRVSYIQNKNCLQLITISKIHFYFKFICVRYTHLLEYYIVYDGILYSSSVEQMYLLSLPEKKYYLIMYRSIIIQKYL